MTEKQKNRMNKFNAREDDLILADLDVMRANEELSPVPLNHLLDDEDAIDRLLIDADFDARGNSEYDDEPFQADSNYALTPDFHQTDTFDDIPDDEDVIDRLLINTGFDANDALEPDRTPIVDDLNPDTEDESNQEFIERIEQRRQPETKENSAMSFHHVEDIDGIADAENADEEPVQTEALMVDDTSSANHCGENFNAQSVTASYSTRVDPETSDAAAIVEAQAEKPEIETQQPAMITGGKPEQVSDNLNEEEITILNNNSFEFDIIQKHLIDCEQKVKKTAFITYVSLAIGIVALLSTIAMGVIVSRMKIEISKLTDLVSILEEDMGSITEKNPEIKFKKKDAAFEQLNQKVNNLSRQLRDQSATTAETINDKREATVVRQATVSKSLDHLKTRIHELEKKKTSEAIVKKVSAKKQVPAKKAKHTRPAQDWSVNLVSYKEKSYAKSKAAKFIKKGVPAKVVAVDVHKIKLYRIKVGGFKNKLEATLYAKKIKQSLNLSSVSVDNNS